MPLHMREHLLQRSIASGEPILDLRRFPGRRISCGKSGADKVEYFQREGPRLKQYAEIARYLRSNEGLMTRAADLRKTICVVYSPAAAQEKELECVGVVSHRWSSRAPAAGDR